ncbi:MAG: ATPase [Candidatus Micrarchaeota archaeon]
MAVDPIASATAMSDAGGIALGAGIAMAGAALATAWAQASIGSAIMGVVAERPEEAMKLIVYMALPELIVLLGFVVAFLMLGKIGSGAEAI